MLNIGAPEMLVILLVALLVLGPERLPGAARQVGKVMGELRRMSAGFQAELRDAIQQEESSPQQEESSPRLGDQPPLAPSPFPQDPSGPVPESQVSGSGITDSGGSTVGQPDPGARPDATPDPNTP